MSVPKKKRQAVERFRERLLSGKGVAEVVLLTVLLLSCGRFTIKDMGGGERWRGESGFPLNPPLKLIWEFKASSTVGNPLLVVDRTLFFPTLDGKIYALDATSGEKIGLLKIRGGWEATCAYFDTSLIIATRCGMRSLYRYDLVRGKYLWSKRIGPIETELLIHNKRIYVATLYNGIHCLDAASGEEIWHFKTGGQLHSSPALAEGTLLFGCDDKNLYALRSDSGRLLWRYTTGAEITATPAVDDSAVYIGSNDSSLYSLRLDNGELNWKFQTGGKIITPCAVTQELVLFGSNDRNLYALDKRDGELRWKFSAESIISTSPLVSGPWVYFGSLDHHLYALDLETGRLVWKFKTKGRIRTSPIIWNKWLFVASEERYLYAFREKR